MKLPSLQLNQLLASLRTENGSVELMEFTDSNFNEMGCLPTDKIIYYDFSTDESDDGATDFLTAISAVQDYMFQLGYHVGADHDGSGGGLYYGFNAFRK